MAVTITSTVTAGYDFTAGEVVTPTKLDSAANPTCATSITTGANTLLGSAAGGAVGEISCTAAGRALIDDAAASDQRTTLGLGTIATQAASAVAITGGSTKLDAMHVNIDALSYSATTDIDLSTSAKTVQTVALTGNVTFTTSNKASGVTKMLRLTCDGTQRTLTFPSWKFIGGAAPGVIAANKTALLMLYCFGTADTDILASYGAEQ